MFLEPHHIIDIFNQYGYYFLVIGLMFEGEVVLLTATLFFFMSQKSFLLFFPLALLGVLLGNNLWYFLGFLFRKKIQNKQQIFFISQKRINALEKFFEKNGDSALFLAKFMYGMGHVTIFIASALSFPYKRFLLIDFLSSLSWVSVNVTIALISARYFHLSIHNIIHSLKIIAIIILAVFLLQFIIREVMLYNIRKDNK